MLLVGILTLVVGGAVVIMLVVRARSVKATAAAIQNEVSKGLGEKIGERLASAEGIVQATEHSILKGDLPLDDLTELAERLSERIRFDDRFDVIVFIRPDGSVAGAQQLLDGSLRMISAEATGPDAPDLVEVVMILPDGQRKALPTVTLPPGGVHQNPTYEAGLASDGLVWTKRYQRRVTGGFGHSCALGVRRDGELVGVLGLGFGTQFIADYLSKMEIAETGVVIGLQATTGQITVDPTSDSDRPLAPVVVETLRRVPGTYAALKPGQPFQTTVAQDGVDYAVALELRIFRDKVRWISAIVIPEHELVGFLDRFLLIGLLGIGLIFVLAVALAGFVAARIARPLKAVAVDLTRVGDFDLSDTELPHSIIEEVAIVGDSVRRMKASLRSFGRYVPTDLVRDLLAQGQEARLDGREQPLTLFFSDIKGFTALSEGMPPQQLIAALGDYLDIVTKSVQEHRGTIDKFMGDGVLAFFNAPRPDEEHVVHGCHAALAVQASLEAAREVWAKGRPPFFTRVGLHTAEVVVGNIGTPDRFSYTVLGDGVNLAARLESLNKAYGTWILASEDVRMATGELFEWRHIDRTAVAGRVGGTEVYELLGTARGVGAVILEARDVYEAALDHYFAREFEEAVRGFAHAATLSPDDLAAVTLGTRARGYAKAPPGADWDGIFVQTQK